jgi:hypothetical protein
MDDMKIKARIEELLNLQPDGVGDTSAWAGELYQGALGMLGLTHGENSTQIAALRDAVASFQKNKENTFRAARETADSSLGALRNLKREVEEGLVGNLRREVTGEVLGDLLQLGKVTLDEGTDNSKNVAAVLVAAAFEDTIRRLGAAYCGIHTRESLPDILAKLKAAEVLKGSQVGVVQSHFQFRNDAMHADWSKIDVVGVKTVMALVQELLLKHFS